MSNTKKKEPEKEIKIPASVVKRMADVAADAAIGAYRAEKEKEREAFKDKRYNNTKLLLRKYRELSEYIRNAVYDSSQLMDEDTGAILEAFGAEIGEVMKVQSIQKNVFKTKMIMEHIDTMLDCYRRKCESSPKPEVKRRWRIIDQMFLADEQSTAQEIADVEHISVSMVYTVVDTACDELSTLFFGLDLTSM